MDDPDLYVSLYAFVRSIPLGKVVTYGQAADAVSDVSLTARQVGSAMRFAPEDVPWQRVVGAGGTLSTGKISPELKSRQRRLLEQEGVTFLPDASDRIDMRRSQWLTPDPDPTQTSLFDEP